MGQELKGGAVAHVRFEGRSLDVPVGALGLGPGPTDQEVRGAVARYLERPEVALHHHVVDRHANGNLTVRPEAVFG